MSASRHPAARSTRVFARAFTLLEVMVAIALLALGLMMLLQVQARSIQLAQQARNMSVATGLARAKLYDCQEDFRKKGFSIGDYDEEGKFDEEGFDTFFWECHAYKPKLPVPDATDITTGLSDGAQAAAGQNEQLSGLAGAASGAGEAASMGAGMIAPILAQVSQVVGESIREMVIIVRWQEGEGFEELRVATHVIDTSQINAVAPGISAQAGAMGGMMGGGGGGGGGSSGSSPNIPPIPGPNGEQFGGTRSPSGGPGATGRSRPPGGRTPPGGNK
jgi:prepilin-type N-terminal cleavage/methylation domain-containing protein